jgi:hypothetical protein
MQWRRKKAHVGSIAKTFVRRSVMLALILSGGHIALPVFSAAQGSPEAVILEQKLKDASRALQQRQREAATAEEQARRRERLAGEFAMLLVKAKAQHAIMEQWHKAHSSELRMKARGGVYK